MTKNYLKLIGNILLLSVLVGILIAIYQFLVHEIIHFSNLIFTSNNYILIAIIIILMMALSFIIIFLNNKYKGFLGSGIPQYEGYYANKLNFSPTKMFNFVLFDSFFAYFCGFILGSEGPSITLSASIARIINKDKDKDLVAACGSAGFACAFLAPLAGICHLIEENKEMLNFKFIIKGVLIICLATTISNLVYPHSLLPIYIEYFLEYKYYYLLILVTVLAFIIGRLYVLAIVKVKDLSKYFKNFLYLTPIFMLLFMYLKTKDLYIIGTGSQILEDPLFTTSLVLLIFYLIYRLLGTAFSNSLALSGGLVLPMLSIGALCGGIITIAFKSVIPDISKYNSLLVVVGMIVVYNSVTKSPLTSLVLGLKMGAITNIILPLTIAIVLNTFLIYLFKQQNIYKLLEKRILTC